MAKLKLTPEQFARIARAIDEPNRLEMLRQIYACKAVNCGDVTHSLSITAGTASHHFRELENAELVKITKVGRYKNLSPRRDVWEAFLAELQQI